MPVEYDYLKPALSDDTIEITAFNRGITLFVSDGKIIRCIQRVLCILDQVGES